MQNFKLIKEGPRNAISSYLLSSHKWKFSSYEIHLFHILKPFMLLDFKTSQEEKIDLPFACFLLWCLFPNILGHQHHDPRCSEEPSLLCWPCWQICTVPKKLQSNPFLGIYGKQFKTGSWSGIWTSKVIMTSFKVDIKWEKAKSLSVNKKDEKIASILNGILVRLRRKGSILYSYTWWNQDSDSGYGFESIVIGNNFPAHGCT